MPVASHQLNRVLHPVVDFEGRDLHIHRRSQHHDPKVWQVRYPGQPLPEWEDIARSKGFRIHARVRDKNHLALECLSCGGLTAQRVFALRTARIRCEDCASQKRSTLADTIGLEFIERDPADHQYAFYRAACGHRIRRQREFIDRVADGVCQVRCEICLQDKERAEAEARGWEWQGPDPDGNDNYRLYRHSCGHDQRIARVNMKFGQCDCAGCGESWSSKPSFLYLFRIRIPDKGLDCVKFGYSGRPDKRLRHQLSLPKSAKSDVLRTVAIKTGHAACRLEKSAHARLRRRFPECVVSPERYVGLINVSSEIYSPALLPKLQRLLDDIEQQQSAA